MNVFRVPFLMERLVPSKMTGTLDSTYLSDLKSVSGSKSPWARYPIVNMALGRPSNSSPIAVLMQSSIPTTMDDSKFPRGGCACN